MAGDTDMEAIGIIRAAASVWRAGRRAVEDIVDAVVVRPLFTVVCERFEFDGGTGAWTDQQLPIFEVRLKHVSPIVLVGIVYIYAKVCVNDVFIVVLSVHLNGEAYLAKVR